jgi:Ca-activated chloride channel homolog
VSFESPKLLIFLLVVPVAIWAVVRLDRRRRRRTAAWAPPGLLRNMVTEPGRWHRFLPVGLLIAGLTLLLVGFARPQATIHVKRQDATVVVVLDVSGSMAAKDAPPTRLGAARAAVNRLVDRLPSGYRMALVTFSDHAAVVQAPTDNKDLIRAALARTRTAYQGTAIADGVVRGVAVAKTIRGEVGQAHPPAVIELFSDGGQTAGGVVEQKLQGGYTEQIQVPAQPASLQLLAQATGGHFTQHVVDFQASRTFAELGSRIGKQPKRVEVTAVAAAGGLAFMLVGGLLSGIWFRRVP